MGMPDAELYPHASGAAGALVEQHKSEAEVKFYAGWFCPFVQRTWMALEEKKIPYQYIEINPYHKSHDFLRINPKGLVPAMEYKGHVMAESNILVEFLEDAFPDSARPLLPREPGERAVVRMHVDFIGKRIVPPYFKCIMSQEHGEQVSARNELCGALKELMIHVDTGKGPFLGGKDINAADVSLAPWVERMQYLEDERGGALKASEAGDTYVAYRQAMLDRPSLRATTSERQHYEPIYRRYLHNEAQSDAAKATRAGKAIP